MCGCCCGTGFAAVAMATVVNEPGIGTTLVVAVVIAAEIDTGMNLFTVVCGVMTTWGVTTPCGVMIPVTGLLPDDSAMGSVMMDEQGTREAPDGVTIDGRSWLTARAVRTWPMGLSILSIVGRTTVGVAFTVKTASNNMYKYIYIYIHTYIYEIVNIKHIYLLCHYNGLRDK